MTPITPKSVYVSTVSTSYRDQRFLQEITKLDQEFSRCVLNSHQKHSDLTKEEVGQTKESTLEGPVRRMVEDAVQETVKEMANRGGDEVIDPEAAKEMANE